MRYRNEVWLADLNPQIGTESGKIRPVVIVQTDLLNEQDHNSTVICPITTKLRSAALVRVFLSSGNGGVFEDCEIMVDQIRTIDNSRFIKKIGKINVPQQRLLEKYLKAVLDLD